MKALFCGDREWDNEELIKNVLTQLPRDAIIIHGNCRGADKIAGKLAEQLGFEVHSYPAEWNVYGRRAGIIRNQQMIDAELPNIVHAFHNNINTSKGIKDMLERARHEKIAFVLHGIT